MTYRGACTAIARRARATSARPTIAELLDDQLTEFDELLRDVRGGIRSPEQYDRFEARATAIAGGIRDAFRRGRAEQS